MGAASLKAMVLVAVGVLLLVVGVNMRAAMNSWDETVTTTTEVPGTKGRNAAIGVATGAVAGGILASVVGGIGIVFAGTGVGLPAGAALIAVAAAMGAGAGGLAGAATGDSATTDVLTSTFTHLEPAYTHWQWGTVLAVGVVLLLLAAYEIRNLAQRPAPRSERQVI